MADASTVTYQDTNKVLSKTANWMRYFSAKIYVHKQTPIVAPSASESVADATVATNQAFAEAQASDLVMDVSQLRCTFSAQHFALYYPNICNLTVYNLNKDFETADIMEGYRLVLDGGYEGNPGQIFDGTILMCTRSKINGTDYILNVLAMDGAEMFQYGFANYVILKGQSARTVVNNLANKASVPISLKYASPVLDKIVYSKAYAVHGYAKDTLDDLAKSIKGLWYIEGGKLYIMPYSEAADQLPMGLKAVELNDKTGLLGNPQQQEQGITGRALMNPAIQLYGFVHLSNSEVTESMVTVGSFSQGISQKYALDPQGLYRVITLNHNGDTRGNSWYTDFTAVTQAGLVPELLSISTTGTMS